MFRRARDFVSVFADGELLSEASAPKFAGQDSSTHTRIYDVTPAEICEAADSS